MSAPSKSPPASRDRVLAGWAALERGAWEEARRWFEAAVADAQTAESLEGLSWAAWWSSDATATFEARERAYGLYRASGDRRGAARVATWLGTDHVDFRGELAVGQGWLARARRLLDDLEPGPEHGWLWVHEAEKCLLTGDSERARALGARAAKLGERLDLVDLQMVALAHEGLAQAMEGDVVAGMSRLDEAAAAALGGEFRELWAVGWACCCLIQACEQVRDYGRAGEWCSRLQDWSERMDVQFLNRVCRAHYAGVLIWRGTWAEAERELVDAAERLAVMRPPMAAEAIVRLGELRRRQGRLAEAAELFDDVAEHPLALLGLAQICLDRGEAAGARDRAEQYLRDVPGSAGPARAAALELLVRAHVRLGQRGLAAAAADELAAIAAAVETDPLRAAASLAEGFVASTAGEGERARRAFEDATRLFHRSGAPFEAARARIELARALAMEGRAREATGELHAAAVSLRRIGAAHEAARTRAVEREFARPASASAQTLSRREREVLRLVAKGNSDRAIAEMLVVSEHTVHRHVANILAKLGCPSRSAAVAEALTRKLI